MTRGGERSSPFAWTTTHLTSTTTSRISTSIKYKDNQPHWSSVCSMPSTTELEIFLMRGVPELSSRTSSKMKGRTYKSSHEESENWAKQQTPIWMHPEGKKQIMTLFWKIIGQWDTIKSPQRRSGYFQCIRAKNHRTRSNFEKWERPIPTKTDRTRDLDARLRQRKWE